MTHALLDTSFILSCVRKKIYFFEDISSMGLEIIIPKQVIDEIKGLTRSKPEAKLALKILDNNEFKKITLKGKEVDNGIINMAEKNKGYVIATLDSEIKNKIKNQKLVIRGEKKLEIL